MTFIEVWRHARTDRRKMARLLCILAAMALGPAVVVWLVVAVVVSYV